MSHPNLIELKAFGELTDRQVVDFYHEWSEYFWCAGFMSLTPTLLEEFIDWLADTGQLGERPFTDYELDLIARFRAKIATEVGLDSTSQSC